MLKKLGTEIKANVQKAAKEGKASASEIHEAVRSAVVHMRKALKPAEAVNRETVAATVSGAIEGIKQTESHLVAVAENEVAEVKEKLKQENERLATATHEAFESALGMSPPCPPWRRHLLKTGPSPKNFVRP